MLLQSYVNEWPGVMCIYGVTQVGRGSIGPSRFLPDLLTALQALKPALVFVTGTWFVFYLLNRRTSTAPLMKRVFLAVLLVGLLAVVDAALEWAYLVIPKKEEFLANGCCTTVIDFPDSVWGHITEAFSSEDRVRWLKGTYYGLNIGMALLLAGQACLPGQCSRGVGLATIGTGAVLSIPVNVAFLIIVAVPGLLRLSQHHCPYDLVPTVPESVVAIALYVLGCFASGWACLAGWFGKCPETEPFLGQAIARILWLGALGYAGSLTMLSIELYLAC
jgi:hypothetical protein